MADSLGGLGGLSDGEGLGGLSGDASMRARDAANMANQGEMSMGFSDTPQSLSDVDTQGMGEGLSAMREDLGAEGGMQLNAGLQDEVQEEEIHAALEDEEEEAPIRAGRAEGEQLIKNCRKQLEEIVVNPSKLFNIVVVVLKTQKNLESVNKFLWNIFDEDIVDIIPEGNRRISMYETPDGEMEILGRKFHVEEETV